MEAIGQQFFNLAIMEQALPLMLWGLRQTVVHLPDGRSAWASRRARLCTVVARIDRAPCVGRRSSGSISFAPCRRWCC